MPDSTAPTLVSVGSTLVSSRNARSRADGEWWIGIVADGYVVLVGAIAALPVTFLFFIDQNVSALLTQQPSVGLKKGSYFRYKYAEK